MIFQPADSSLGAWVARAQGRTHPAQDASHSSATHTPALSHSRTTKTGQFTCVRIFGMREGNKVPGENPRRLGGNLKTPHRQWPWLGINFFSHQFYNKITWNKTMAFEDLLYTKLFQVFCRTEFCPICEISLQVLSDSSQPVFQLLLKILLLLVL